MGYDRAHAIIVSTWDDEHLTEARSAAIDLGCAATEIVASNVGGTATFVIVPDGSKEGWAESDLGDQRRDAFVDWLRSQANGDGSSRFAWVEVQYGDDDSDTRALRSSDADRVNAQEASGA